MHAVKRACRLTQVWERAASVVACLGPQCAQDGGGGDLALRCLSSVADNIRKCEQCSYEQLKGTAAAAALCVSHHPFNLSLVHLVCCSTCVPRHHVRFVL